MGFLDVGTPLNWEELQRIKAIIRLYGLLQFIHIYKCNRNRFDKNLMFGDEMEFMILKNNETLKESSLFLCASDLIDAMMNLESTSECEYGSHWTPEYASYIIEGTPAVPFKFDLNSFLFVEDCLRIRRLKLNSFLSPLCDVSAVTIPCFPNILVDHSVLACKRKNAEQQKRKFEQCKNEGTDQIQRWEVETTQRENEDIIIRRNTCKCEDMKEKEMKREKKIEKNSSHNTHPNCNKENTISEGRKTLSVSYDEIDSSNQCLTLLGETESANLLNIYKARRNDLEINEMIHHKKNDLLVDDTSKNEEDEEEAEEKEEDDAEEQEEKEEDDAEEKEEDAEEKEEEEAEEKEEAEEEAEEICVIEQDVIKKENNFLTNAVKNCSLLGCEIYKPEHMNVYSHSVLITDSLISPHPRFYTLTMNIRSRRGAKVVIFNPIYKDKYTNDLDIWKDALDPNDERLFVKKKKKLHLDSHLIWNKSLTNIKQILTETNDVLKNDTKHIHEENPNRMDHVIKSSLFLNIDKDDEYIDVFNRKFIEEYTNITKNPVKEYVYLDAMGFGMGMCCQQVTMSCATIEDARYLYDQLAVIAPLFLAITAATPYLRGFLTDTDTRWRIISNCVDCRTEEEETYLAKPRYSGISLYISDELPLKNNYYLYNDIDVVLDKNIYEKLKKEDVDEYLARHISSLFVRDPLVVFKGSYNEGDMESLGRMSIPNPEDEITKPTKHLHEHFLKEKLDFIKDVKENVLTSNQHFENFQSTNWNSVRFKPPPIADHLFDSPSSIGWRVEFRTPDIQITDFENAAIITGILLLSKVILEERLNLYIPMSLVEENIFRSAERDAILKRKFFFRKNLDYHTTDNEIEEKSIYEIFFNEENGIFYICAAYVERHYSEGIINETVRNKIFEYLEFIKLRCNGTLATDAAYLRNFIRNHPAYQYDSVINSKINYDLCKLITDIGKGLIIPQELLGAFVDPYKERIRSDLRQINKSQYLKSLAYKFISGEDYTQYLLLCEDLKMHNQDYDTGTKCTNCEKSADDSKLEFGRILYQFSA